MRKIYLLLLLAITITQTGIAGFIPGENRFAGHRFFASDVIQPADVTVCNGATTSPIVFASNFPGTTFSWVNNTTSIGLAASGTGNIAAFTAVNTGTTPVVATITVTPSDGVTNGTPKTFTITVNPVPTVNNVANQNVCRNSPTTAVNFTGTVPGTTYSWTNNNTSTGLAASGNGNIPSFTATNSTAAPITSTVTATPRFGTAAPELLYYKFDGSGSAVPNLASTPPSGTAAGTINGVLSQGGSGVCGGALQSAGSSTNAYFNTGWTANTTTSWTISFISSGFPTTSGFSNVAGSFLGASPITILHSGAPVSGGFSLSFGPGANLSIAGNFSGTHTITFVYDMAADQLRGYVDGVLANSQSTGAAPVAIDMPSFYVGNASGNSSNGSIRAGSSMDEFRMYNRALSLSEIQALTNSCNGGGVCIGTPETFTYTVYPDLVVNDPADQTVCAGSATAAVNFTGTSGAVYNWTNSNPAIGLAASGTGNIASFTPTFSGTAPVTATITVTPSFSSGPACTSSSQTFTITVNPIPNVNNVANQTVCNNTSVSTINFSGSVSGTTYSWTNSNTSIGLAASGSGNIPSFTAINATGSPITATITVTPTFGGCTGSPKIFGITVNPSPVVNPVSSQNVCTGSNTAAINFTGNVPGATYNWTNSNPSIGLAASGTGNIASFTATNTGTTTQTATITVTPVSPSVPACPGTTVSFTISVSPVPTGTPTPASQTVCSAAPITPVSFTGNVPGITFDWTRDNLATVTGIPGVGNGNISGTLTNTANVPVTVTFTVTPSLGGCVGTPFTVTVIVKESTVVATATPASQTICSGNITDIVPSSNYAGATYNWTRNNTSSVTGIAASGTGTISGTLLNTTTSPVTVTFTITPSFNGCDGAPITATVLVNAVPTITCPAPFSVNNNPGICGATVNYNTTVTGAPAPTLSYTFSGATTGSGAGNGSGSVLNVGQTTVTVTATNICGSTTCSFRVTVVDTENPTITCPTNIQANTDAGSCAATVATPNPVVADNCAVTVQTWSLSGATTGASSTTGINNVSTRLFNKGVTTVKYTVLDAAGNSNTCTYTVTIRDQEAPVIICPANITVTTQAGLCVAEVAYTVNATDNCPGVVTQLVSGPASGSAFPLGVTTVTWRAIDAATNISTNCSFTITVLDGQLPVISQQPVNRTVCVGSNATFSVTAATAPNTGGPIAYQWQQWNGLQWNNISGANAASYTVNNVTMLMNTNTFRVVLTGLCTVVNSSAATLFVNPLPSISVSANAISSLLPGQNTSLVATVSPTGGSFVWTKNNAVVPGVSVATLTGLTVDNIGVYKATYTDLNGCAITSPDVVLAGQPSQKMWVYPNPNNGRFQVRYYNSFGSSAAIKIYSANGQLVYQKESLLTESYSRMDVDLGINAQGMYIVRLMELSSGRVLEAKQIIVTR